MEENAIIIMIYLEKKIMINYLSLYIAIKLFKIFLFN